MVQTGHLFAPILEFALEGRRRVKEQLKKMGSFEYYQTSFSYTMQETGEEKFVGVPDLAEDGLPQFVLGRPETDLQAVVQWPRDRTRT